MTFSLRRVTSASDPDFEVAFAALEAEFAPRGELERREVIERWLAEADTYRLLVARADDGAFAGVRDFHVIDHVIYLAHVLVLPPYRRSGLGALLRRAPLEGAADGTLVAAEMEPPSLEDPASLVRLVAYGRDGFKVIDPRVLHYRQPDFRQLRDGEVARPIPLLAVVKVLGQKGAKAIPVTLARAFVTHLYRVFGTHVRKEHLAALEAETLAPLEGLTELALLPLPHRVEDRAAFLPLEVPR